MKVAIIHYWLIQMRGGEKVLEALCELYPQADIYTHVYDPEAISPIIKRHTIYTSFIQKLPMAAKYYQKYLPLMPLALEQFDLRDYDLVISSESGPAKGVLTTPNSLHICYCHTPMRYVWDMYHDYRASAGRLTRMLMPALVHYLRQWDQTSAARVDHFIANSHNVAQRIRKHYRREAKVIHPLVAHDEFFIAPKQEDFYLMVGQLVNYKRTDLAVRAFNRMGKRLVVIGEGEQLPLLREIAGPNIYLLGRQPFSVIREHYATCQALIFPGEEDFGIVPLEAMASGRPVIAYAKGGALETVVDGVTGQFFQEQTVDSLVDAVQRFERTSHSFDPTLIAQHAQRFEKEQFKARFTQTVEQWLAVHERPQIKSSPLLFLPEHSAEPRLPVESNETGTLG